MALYALDDGKNVTAVCDSTGAVQERYGYSGFGAPAFMGANFTARTVSNYTWETLFCGYRFDSESGFYQVRYRYLHAELGRWLSRDPIGENGGLNLYGFALNNPIELNDSFGLLYCAGVIGRHPQPIDPNMASWFFGTAPDNTYYGPDAPQTHAMERSNIVKAICHPLYAKQRTIYRVLVPR